MENLTLTKCRCGKETICENCDMCKCGHKKTDHKKVGTMWEYVNNVKVNSHNYHQILSCQVRTWQIGKDGGDICDCRKYDKDLKDQRTLFQ